ncbi:MAG TPA: hypothetical protein VFT99_19310, partial [Roseiflexaceae bacterium]|nr:hypothetical protein [Roseiflexaceae bacterium]
GIKHRRATTRHRNAHNCHQSVATEPFLEWISANIQIYNTETALFVRLLVCDSTLFQIMHQVLRKPIVPMDVVGCV